MIKGGADGPALREGALAFLLRVEGGSTCRCTVMEN